MRGRGFFAILMASSVTLASVGLLAKRRRQMRRPNNPSGIADANLSIDERRQAAEEFQRLDKEEGGET
ncbi:MAG: hypothetical protein IIB23_04395 [Chloroflexi bacterium]|nr:hypothetical protein [Chloroflexota bacterium]